MAEKHPHKETKSNKGKKAVAGALAGVALLGVLAEGKGQPVGEGTQIVSEDTPWEAFSHIEGAGTETGKDTVRDTDMYEELYPGVYQVPDTVHFERDFNPFNNAPEWDRETSALEEDSSTH